MRDVKSVLSRLEPMIVRIEATLTTTLPHLATKADLADLRSEVTREISDPRTEVTQDNSGLRPELTQDASSLRSEMTLKLADLPTRTYMWGILVVLITAYGSGLAALAVLK
ncbi:MAG TPA: hypothetical protein VHU42_19080 [Rhodopila sp.]|nr:hypothetical protein [Rhodopila sp.]